MARLVLISFIFRPRFGRHGSIIKRKIKKFNFFKTEIIPCLEALSRAEKTTQNLPGPPPASSPRRRTSSCSPAPLPFVHSVPSRHVAPPPRYPGVVVVCVRALLLSHVWRPHVDDLLWHGCERCRMGDVHRQYVGAGSLGGAEVVLSSLLLWSSVGVRCVAHTAFRFFFFFFCALRSPSELTHASFPPIPSLSPHPSPLALTNAYFERKNKGRFFADVKVCGSCLQSCRFSRVLFRRCAACAALALSVVLVASCQCLSYSCCSLSILLSC